MFRGRGGKGGRGPVGAGPGADANVFVELGLFGSETVPNDFDRAARGLDDGSLMSGSGAGTSDSFIGREAERGGICGKSVTGTSGFGINCSTEADTSCSRTAPPLVAAGEFLELAFGVPPLGLSMMAESACNLLAPDGINPILGLRPGKLHPGRACSSGKTKAGCVRLLTCVKGGR